MLTPGVILTPAGGRPQVEDAGGFGGRILVGKGWGSLHVELKIIDNTSTQHPVFLDIPWAQKNMWLVTSYLSYRLNLYTTGVLNICWQQEYIYTRAGEDTGGFGDRILGKKVGDQCIFTLLLMQNPSKRLQSQEDFKPNFYKWPWDCFFCVKKRFLRSLVKLDFKLSRSFLVKLEKEDLVIYRLCKIHHRLNLYSSFQHLNRLMICYNT